MLSVQAVGTSIALALFCLNSYFFATSVKEHRVEWDHLFTTIIFLLFALAPWLVDKFLTSRYASLNFLGERRNWIYWWALFPISYVAREYISPFMCVSCFPPAFHKFLAIMFAILVAVAIIGAALFSLFVLITRFSLKKLASTDSTPKSIALLLLGCLPIPIFWILLEVLVFVLNHATLSEKTPGDPNPVSHFTKSEWLALGSVVIFSLAFFINLAFLLAPILFFSMAMLLLVHRLLWPIVDRPLNKLNEVGLMKHRKIIIAIGVAMILIGINRFEWMEKALKFFGH